MSTPNIALNAERVSIVESDEADGPLIVHPYDCDADEEVSGTFSYSLNVGSCVYYIHFKKGVPKVRIFDVTSRKFDLGMDDADEEEFFKCYRFEGFENEKLYFQP